MLVAQQLHDRKVGRNWQIAHLFGNFQFVFNYNSFTQFNGEFVERLLVVRPLCYSNYVQVSK